jgi:acyl dehydratase
VTGGTRGATKVVDVVEAVMPGSIEELQSHIGVTLGPTVWRDVPQVVIDGFAETTGDRQWIHVDPMRASAGPFKGTVAHGLLALGIANALAGDLISFDRFTYAINYGYQRVRFPAPVPVGSRVRLLATITAVSQRTTPPGAFEVRTNLVLEIEEASRPGCVAESMGLLMRDPA